MLKTPFALLAVAAFGVAVLAGCSSPAPTTDPVDSAAPSSTATEDAAPAVELEPCPAALDAAFGGVKEDAAGYKAPTGVTVDAPSCVYSFPAGTVGIPGTETQTKTAFFVGVDSSFLDDLNTQLSAAGYTPDANSNLVGPDGTVVYVSFNDNSTNTAATAAAIDDTYVSLTS